MAAARRLYHNALLHHSAGDMLAAQLLVHALNDLSNLQNLIQRGDHRIHDEQISVDSSPQKRPELRPKNIRAVQADADGAISQRRILLRIQVKIIRLLVRTDVHGPNNDPPVIHQFQGLPINLILLFLCGKFSPVQVEKFAAEQTDTLRVVLQRQLHLIKAAHIGIDQNAPAILCDRLFAFQFLELAAALLYLRFYLIHGRQYLLIRIYVEYAVDPIDHCQFPVPLWLDMCLYQSWDIQCSGENRRMGVDRTALSHKPQQLTPV